MEESDSGLFHHLGKVAWSKGHREFESLLLRPHKNDPPERAFLLGEGEQATACLRERFEALLPYL